MTSRRQFHQTTKISLHERFTYLRNVEKRAAAAVTGRVNEHLDASRNKRHELQFEQRQNFIASMKKKNQPRSLAIRERLSLPRGYIARRRGAGRGGYVTGRSPLLRGFRKSRLGVGVGNTETDPGASNVRSRISRSPFPSRRGGRQRSLSRNRSLSRARSSSRSGSVNRSVNLLTRRSRSPFPRRFRGNYIRRGRGGRFRGKRGQFSGTSLDRGNFREINDRQTQERTGGRGRGRRGRGRGMGRGIGRGRGRDFRRGNMNNRLAGMRNRVPVPTKEELDQELDQYMASSRSGFDKDKDNNFMTADDEENWQ